MRLILLIYLLLPMGYVLKSNAQSANTALPADGLQAVIDKAVDQKKVFGVTFGIKKNGQEWHGQAGNFEDAAPFFIGSTTKLFTTALIMKLRAEGKLSLDDFIYRYLDEATIQGLHVYKGEDHSKRIQIRHLLAHTSGLPDYFQGKNQNGSSLEERLTLGNDSNWTFNQAIEGSKSMSPLFAPGAKGKAHYSDTNFQLLGKIIEALTAKSYAENVETHLIRPLGLTETYLYADAEDRRPKVLYFKDKPLEVYQAMASFDPDGGMVSTTSDLLAFGEAFFGGKLFPTAYLAEMQEWNSIFFPLESGIGIHRFKLPWVFNPTGAVPPLIGHSGLSGALLFYSPKDGSLLAGTVNQVAHPDISFRVMIKLLQKAK